MVTAGIVATVIIAILFLIFIIGTKKGVDEINESPKPPEHDASPDKFSGS